MTQDDKDLLLQDLCARLPYNVKVESVFINTDTKKCKSCGIEVFDATCILMIRDGFGEFKPYLFPLSSMTKKQQKEANVFDDMDIKILAENLGENYRNKTNIPTATYNYIDWLNKNHFDYRGLIEKGLAIDATGLNIYR